MIDLSQLTEEQLNELELQIQKHKEQQKVKDAIVFCVENPTDCKAEYLKLR